MTRVGRRRRRLYWTVAALVGVSLLGTAIGVAYYRARKPATYRSGEDHAEITRNLELNLPEDAPQPAFADVTEAAGLATFRSFAGARTSQLPEDMGSGAAWGDFDNDGDDDLFVVGSGGPLLASVSDRTPSILYENRGDGTFARVEDFPETRILGMAAAWGDHDGDGWLDLIVTGHDSLLFFRNDGGKLERSTAIADREGYWAGASWADFDRDGDLDLYVCGYVDYVADSDGALNKTQQYGRAVAYTLNPASFDPGHNLLFRNDGNGGFEEVAEALGVHNVKGRSLGALWHDFDDDGWPDLYIANDISDNALYRNREGTFEEISHEAWVADYRGAMGLAAGDWNRDGDDDLFVSHWVAQENALYDSLLRDFEKRSEEAKGLRFVDVADQRGLGQIALQVVGWGAEFADFDADGWLDLAVANGSTFETNETPRRLEAQSSFLFWNRQGKSFHDLAPLNPVLSAPHVSRGLATSDYDLDGDVDILIVDRDDGVRLLRNEMAAGNWLEVRLAANGGVTEGAQVLVRLPDALLRRTLSSVSYLSQSSRTLHFGLGTATTIDGLEVRWPDGTRDVHERLAPNTIVQLTRGDSTARTVGSPKGAATPAGLTERETLLLFWKKQRAAMNAMKIDRDQEAAIVLFREALAIDPAHEDSLYYLGNCLAETGEIAEALGALAELTRLNPMSHRGHKRWGTLMAVTARTPADMDRAAEALERAFSINQEGTGALLALSEINLLRGRRTVARDGLELVVRTNPQADEGFFVLGYLAWKEQDFEQAVDLLRKAKESRREEWKPEGVVAEGEVRRKMHVEATPLARFFKRWNGTLDPDEAFAELDAGLDGSS